MFLKEVYLFKCMYVSFCCWMIAEPVLDDCGMISQFLSYFETRILNKHLDWICGMSASVISWKRGFKEMKWISGIWEYFLCREDLWGVGRMRSDIGWTGRSCYGEMMQIKVTVCGGIVSGGSGRSPERKPRQRLRRRYRQYIVDPRWLRSPFSFVSGTEPCFFCSAVTAAFGIIVAYSVLAFLMIFIAE